VLLAAALLAPPRGFAQPEQPGTIGERPSREIVRKALDKVANDPNLAPERTVRMLRLVEAKPPTEDDEPWWWDWANALARWTRGLFGWLAESGRYLVWVIGAGLALGIVAYVVHLIRKRGLPRVPQRFVAPSHVRDLDIRPESLPDDVGAAALALWERGEQRAALALLYRGLLSRLVHVHSVPIRASSTEGECLTLAKPHLEAASDAYAGRLVAVWSAAVYGGVAPATPGVQALCAEFGAALDRAAGTAT
jgi:hypothetical protein